METLQKDLRYAVRMLLRFPGFTLVTVITLALGIGANTAIFSIVNALLVRTLPVERPEELAVIGDPTRVHSLSQGSPQTDLFSYPLYRELLNANEAFTDIAATGRLDRAMASVELDGQVQPPEKARARMVSNNLFSVLGVKPLIGRTFPVEKDAAPGSTPYVVISYSYWKRRFNADPGAIGSTLRINNYPFTVIGVTPPGFLGEVVGDSLDFRVPVAMQAQVIRGRQWLDDASVSWLLLVGRRKPGVSLEEARASVNLAFQRIATSSFASRFDADNQQQLRKRTVPVSDGGRGLSRLRAQLAKPLLLLMGIVGLVLLIACVNVANLLLARSSGRQTEVAVRLAMGASPSRLMRQLLTESVLLALLGAAFALLLANWGAQALVRLVTGAAGPFPLDLSLDWRVLGFTGGAALITGVLFGLAPALRARRVDVGPALKEGARTGVSAAGPKAAGKYLVAAQLALSVLVLFTAALLVRSLKNLQELDTGYERSRLLLVRVDGIAAGYRGPKLVALFEELASRFRRLPGVTAATFSENGLFSGAESATTIIVEGFVPQREEDELSNYDVVGANYFSTVGIPLLLGRDIGAQDIAGAPRVAVINQAMAHDYFPNRNPIGRKLYFDDEKMRTIPYEIVGVAADVRDHELRGEVPRRFYVPAAQVEEDPSDVNFEIRTTGNPAAAAEAARKVVQEFDPNLPALSVRTLTDLVDDTLNDQILVAKLSSLFAALALTLASVGLYGLISYAVARRTREIGLRMALGARAPDLLWLVLREVLGMVAIGLAAGIPLAIAASRALHSMLFEITSLDPVSLFGTVLLLGLVAAAATYVPARRATKVDPMVALRNE